MKSLITISAFVALAWGCLTACGGDDEPSSKTNDSANLSVSEMTFTADGGSQTATVTTNHEWSAYASQSWVTVSPTSSVNQNATLTVTAAANTTYETRTATVTLMAGTARATITVNQAAAEKPATTDTIQAPLEGYTLVWNDEFNEGSTPGADWTYEVQGAGWVNNELQAYTKTNDVATVSNGTLKITCKKVNDKIYSARLYAKKTTGWKYGYIEASIKLPTGKGTWPAFWMMPVNFSSWPADGEIDIMEEVGYNPNVVVSTIHCNKYNNTGTSVESASKSVSTAQTQFHKYAVEWTASYMTFYVDGTSILTYRNDGTGKDAWPFDANFYVILNLAWGGDWGGAQGVDESCLPATMEVDYVRVFQKE